MILDDEAKQKRAAELVRSIFKAGVKQADVDALGRHLADWEEAGIEDELLFNAFSDLQRTAARLRRDLAYLQEQARRPR